MPALNYFSIFFPTWTIDRDCSSNRHLSLLISPKNVHTYYMDGLLSCIIVTMSSCVLYMYGYQKFMAFISLERDKNNIVLREGRTSLWSYFSHCSAMCVLIALAGDYVYLKYLHDYCIKMCPTHIVPKNNWAKSNFMKNWNL